MLGLCKVRLTFRPIADFAGVAAHQVTPASPRCCVHCLRCTSAQTRTTSAPVPLVQASAAGCAAGNSCMEMAVQRLPAARGMSAWLRTGPGSRDCVGTARSCFTAEIERRSCCDLLKCLNRPSQYFVTGTKQLSESSRRLGALATRPSGLWAGRPRMRPLLSSSEASKGSGEVREVVRGGWVQGAGRRAGVLLVQLHSASLMTTQLTNPAVRITLGKQVRGSTVPAPAPAPPPAPGFRSTRPDLASRHPCALVQHPIMSHHCTDLAAAAAVCACNAVSCASARHARKGEGSHPRRRTTVFTAKESVGGAGAADGGVREPARRPRHLACHLLRLCAALRWDW